MWISYLLKRWFLLLMVVGIGLSLFWPQLLAWLLDPIETRPVTVILLGLSSIGLESRKLWHIIRRPWPALLAAAISFGLAPPLAYLAAHQLLPADYQIGLIIAGCVPCTLASATIWTRLAGGNEAVALMVTMFTNSTVFIFTASWLVLLTGQQVEFDTQAMLMDLFFVVALPILAGQLIRRIEILGNFATENKRPISVICRLLILVIIVKSAAQAELMLAERGQSLLTDLSLLGVLLVCIGLHLVLLLIGFWCGKGLFAIEDALAIAFSGSQKTLPVGVFLIADYYSSVPLAIVPMLFFHIGQLLVDTYVAERFFYHHAHPKLALGQPTQGHTESANPDDANRHEP